MTKLANVDSHFVHAQKYLWIEKVAIVLMLFCD